MAQIKKEFKESNLTHACELEEANRQHVRELAEVREECKKAKETYEHEKNEAPPAIPRAQSIRVSY